MTTSAEVAAPGRIHWGRALVGGFLIELVLALITVPFVALGRTEVLPDFVLPATAIAAVLAGSWVARRVERPVLHGALTGLAAILLYILIAVVSTLLAPDQADFTAALSPTYLASHAIKVLGAMAGAWLVSRRRL